MKNLYQPYLIDKEIKTFLENKFATKENTNIDHNNKAFLTTNYHTLVLIQAVPRKKIYELCKTF